MQSDINKIKYMTKRSPPPLISKFLNRLLALNKTIASDIISTYSGSFGGSGATPLYLDVNGSIARFPICLATESSLYTL